jgi:ketosteroid isomerase-like protein
VDAAAAARAWVDAWERAWPTGDVDAVAPVYSDGAVFYSHPFREPEAPRDYVTWAFAEQASAVCRFGDPIVAGDRAAVDWWAVMTAPDGSEESIAGTSLLRFGGEGRVVEQRDVWAIEPGSRDLPGWARREEPGLH